jgi:predicted transcriptional regulator
MNTTISPPVIEAQKILKSLFGHQSQEMGRQPTVDEFYPIPVEDIILRMGWHVDRVSMVGQTQDFQPADAKVDFDEKTITLEVQGQLPQGRINWSLAHELGHILLHAKESRRTLLRTRSMRGKHSSAKQREPLDVEADRFAAELLMPGKAVKIKFRQFLECDEITVDSSLAKKIWSPRYNARKAETMTRWSLATVIAAHEPAGTAPSLAAFFAVSNEAMARRLVELGLVLD